MQYAAFGNMGSLPPCGSAANISVSSKCGCRLSTEQLDRFALAANVGNPPFVSIDMNGPELTLQRSNDAAAQLSLSGRSFIALHLDRFMDKKLHDVAN